MYDEYDDGEGGASLGRKLAMAIGVIAIAAAGFFAFKAVSGGDDDGGEQVAPASGSSVASDEPDGRAAASSSPDTTEEPEDTAARTTEDTASASTEPDRTSTTTTVARTTTTVAPTTTAAPTTAPPPPTTLPPAPYDTLPDGSPAWVTALFGVDRVTLSGVVPDQAAKDRLQTLAIANARPGQAGTIENLLTINPAVPRNVGVRVVELTSVRFPEGSAEVLPPHAAELDRVVGIMQALPHVTALVIGHADQRGHEATNFALSEARADAVTTYLATHGVDPARLSSRAVGEADLLTLNDDAAALELNRRTEFVFFGLLIG